MTMVARTAVFLDTNVLLRFDKPDFNLHTEVRRAVQQLVHNENELWIST